MVTGVVLQSWRRGLDNLEEGNRVREDWISGEDGVEQKMVTGCDKGQGTG